MNEELRSTNEELDTINTELRTRSAELSTANLFLHSILTSLRSAVIVVDRQLNVLIWNDRAQDMWGLREDEVRGKSILTLDIGLPVKQLEGPMHNCLGGTTRLQEIELEARNRRGQNVRCSITCTPLCADTDGQVPGMVLLINSEGTGQ